MAGNGGLMADGGKTSELLPLSQRTLADLPEDVSRPTYDRSRLTPGIVHIGLGNFHRAHQAWYLHGLMRQGKASDWTIGGAGVRPADAVQRERLRAQDCLTKLIELDPAGKSAKVTGAMTDFLPVDPDNAALIRQMADPAIRIVSLTVTEGGYCLDPASGGFDAAHPDIRHDAARPKTPRTAFGAMIAALRMRRDADHGPFTGQSCDNLQGNGAILRQTVISLARLSAPALADWVDTNCRFPNAMVDCIVPATGPSEIALAHSFGIKDAARVTMTDNVHAFEAMKIRILNGGHQIIADPAEILGIETIAASMAHPLIRTFLHKVVTKEIAPHMAPMPGMTLQGYLALIDRRFSNPKIRDTTGRMAYDGASRHPGFLVPSIRDGLAKGTPVTDLALASAFWARYCQGTREDGRIVEPNDPNWDALHATAQRAQKTPEAWLEM